MRSYFRTGIDHAFPQFQMGERATFSTGNWHGLPDRIGVSEGRTVVPPRACRAGVHIKN